LKKGAVCLLENENSVSKKGFTSFKNSIHKKNSKAGIRDKKGGKTKNNKEENIERRTDRYKMSRRPIF